MSGAELAQWLVDNGGIVSPAVRVAEETARGRSLWASRNIDPGELVLRIPLSVAIKPEMGLEVLRDAGLTPNHALADEVLLAAYVAEHLGAGGFHSKYFRALPALRDLRKTLPLLWDRDHLRTVPSLQDVFLRFPTAASIVEKEIEGLQAAVEAEWLRLAPWHSESTCRKEPIYSKDIFYHAWAIVSSRNFLIRHPRWIRGGRCFLLPFADLLNHGGSGHGECLRWEYNLEEDAIVFISVCSVLQNQELLINYSGQESGRNPFEQEQPFHFLICYGFLEEGIRFISPTQTSSRRALPSPVSSSSKRLRSIFQHVTAVPVSYHPLKVQNQLPCTSELQDNFANPGWWRSIGHDLGLHVSESEFFQARFTCSCLDLDIAKQSMREEGYVQLNPGDLPEWSLALQSMRTLIDRLHIRHIPPVFCFMFDEFWSAFSALAPILRELLGGDFVRLSDLWAWRVDSATEQAGWSKHRDRGSRDAKSILHEDGMPKSLTVWIPLSDVTTHHSCMYILPASRDPQYWGDKRTIPDEAWGELVEGIRALPVNAGGVLMWSQRLMHWGSVSSKSAQGPRYSLSIEFQSTAIPPLCSYGVSNPASIPSFQDRIIMIASVLRRYQHMYGYSEEWANLSRKAEAMAKIMASSHSFRDA